MSNVFLRLIAVTTMLGTAVAVSNDDFAQKILSANPKADRDGDGMLSASEQAAVVQQILKRFPQVDRDGDGKLSDAEKQGLLRMAGNRSKRKRPAKPGSQSPASSSPGPGVLLEKLGLKSELDIEYRENTKQQRNRLDFIYPKTNSYEKAPLFIYIHGGGNTGGTKNALYNRSDLILKELTDAGIAVATIDYRVFGQGEELGFHHLFQDCKDALRFLAKNADRFGIDQNKFVTWGTSAGGSKALITALTESDFLPGEVSGPGTEHTVIGAISFFGATTYLVPELWQKRLERFPSRSQSKAEMMLKPSDGMSPEEIKKLVSADQHLKSDSPPILLVHGDTDPTVPIELSKHLHEVAKEHNVNVKLVEVKNAGHGFSKVRGNPAQPSMTWDETQQLVVQQVLKWIE
ncbi:MAG: alpha/beta hydrolase fold domain-containing protein [Planctomycetaceae bacterium]|nr:alpha/beta hydrolase fold domain-containing protein [Planctomycetaceae bacterium]